MDLRKIKKLIEMLQESDLNEIEVREGEESVRINREKDVQHIVHQSAESQASQPKKKSKKAYVEENIEDDSLKNIKSPMVGTFYSKPSPEEPPFVITGQEVKKGDTLCLIEVMKLFTAVECTADGTVEMIFAEDGALVEFDQPLFSIT